MKQLAFITVIVFIGLAGRLFLLSTLPVWLDEKSAIYWITLPLYTLFSGSEVLDKAHPPGYYILLKYWSLIFHSSSVVVLRLSNIFFYFVNCILFYKVGTKVLNEKFGLYIVTAYCLSGYSIIFDWQLKQYAGLVTIILLSLYILLLPKGRWSVVAMFAVSYAGLLFDYGYIWYMGALVVLLLLLPFMRPVPKETGKLRAYLLPAVLAGCLYAVTWLPRMSISQGLSVIEWTRFYARPDFVFPFLLGGAHSNILMIFFLMVLLITGCIGVIQKKHQRMSGIMLLGLIAYGAAAFANNFFPLLHVRSLQVAGMAIMFLYAFVFYQLEETKKYIVLLLVLSVYAYNFVLILQTHTEQPGKLLINFLL